MAKMFTVDLRCGHQNRFPNTPPKHGEIVWCHDCRGFNTVTGTPAPKRTGYKLICQHTGCGFTRYPQYEQGADVQGTKHHKRTKHAVEVYDRFDQVVKIITGDPIVTKS